MKSIALVTIGFVMSSAAVRGDKFSHTYHLENWLGTLEQLTAK